jgi:uncharacterized DUF497 family protein
MRFEFDKNKSKLNKHRHGIDFETAKKLWTDPDRIQVPARWVDEPRYLLIAKLGDEIWSAIYTKSKNRIRILSVRKSRND